MTSTRKTSVIVGALFLTQTVAFVIAEQLITWVLKGPDYLTCAAAHTNALIAGGLLAVRMWSAGVVAASSGSAGGRRRV